MATTASQASRELQRWSEILTPVEAAKSDGPKELPAEEQAAFLAALEACDAEPLDALATEELVATFARGMWSAPGWAQPPARIARVLTARAREFPDAERARALATALRLAERSHRMDHTELQARLAIAEVRLACGDLAAAEKAAAILPSTDSEALALRAEIAAARGRLNEAIKLRAEQIEHATSAAELRHARLRLAELHSDAGQPDRALSVLRDSLAEFPDHAASRRALGRLLWRSGELADAFAEFENAVLLGAADGRGELEQVAAELDRRSLAAFREALLTGSDGARFELCPAASATTSR